MADKASDIPNAGPSRHASDADARIDASADELAELDSLVSSLVDEINDATDEISRVMASDDEDTQTAMAIDSGKALSDDGALEAAGSDNAPDTPDADSDDAIAEAAEDLDDDDAPVDAESIDEALEKVAAELEADFDAAGASPSLDEDATHEADAEPEGSAIESGEDSIAAQIDEELARAFGEEDDAPTPEPASEVEEEEVVAEPEPTPDAETPVEEEPAGEPDVDASTEEPLEDEAPADPAATEEAVHAVAEAIDRLLDEEVGDDAQDAPSEPSDEVTDDEPIDDDEAEPEAAAPAPPAPPPAPAKKPAPKAEKPKPNAEPAPEPKPARSFSPMGVLVGALVLANKPFASIPTGLRDTLGLAGLVTLFNAMCLWVFLLLR